jgi:1-acyl-sn-glycerol-3-phosphate acyltransferase
MANDNFLHKLAKRTPSPLAGALEIGGGYLSDLTGLLDRSVDDLDQWDPEYVRLTLPLLRQLFGGYFRSETRGLEHVPAEGPVLLVGNHSGGLMIADTFVFALEFYERFGPQRRFHQLAHDLAARHPLTGGLRRYGTVPASRENAIEAFRRDGAVLVYPGGDWETFRPSWHSDEIEFGGRQGFIDLALSEGVPIVPVVAIGGQETALFVTRGRSVARALRLDRLFRLKVLPVSIGPPSGLNILDLPGRIPIPSKVTVQVMPPIDLEARFGPRPDADIVYEEVTGEMQETLHELSEERTVPVVG